MKRPSRQTQHVELNTPEWATRYADEGLDWYSYCLVLVTINNILHSHIIQIMA